MPRTAWSSSTPLESGRKQQGQFFHKSVLNTDKLSIKPRLTGKYSKEINKIHLFRFEKHESDGIDTNQFAELLLTSGKV